MKNINETEEFMKSIISGEPIFFREGEVKTEKGSDLDSFLSGVDPIFMNRLEQSLEDVIKFKFPNIKGLKITIDEDYGGAITFESGPNKKEVYDLIQEVKNLKQMTTNINDTIEIHNFGVAINNHLQQKKMLETLKNRELNNPIGIDMNSKLIKELEAKIEEHNNNRKQ